jgi:hypothetical protein
LLINNQISITLNKDLENLKIVYLSILKAVVHIIFNAKITFCKISQFLFNSFKVAQHPPNKVLASQNIDTFRPLGYPGYAKSERISSLAFFVKELNCPQGQKNGEKVLLDKIFYMH